MTPAIAPKPRFRHLSCIAALVFAATAALSSCGETGSNSAQPETSAPASAQTQQVGIRLSSTGREKHNDGGSDLLNLAGSWHSWGAESSSITFDTETNRLRITQPTDASGIALGVRRFDGVLTAGNWYSLTVDANGTGAAAVIFLIDTELRVRPAVTNADGGLLLATDESALSFNAPENIIGFYLQVQSSYQANANGSLIANILTQNVPDSAISPEAELIAIAQQWPHWDGSPSQVSYDTESERLRIDPPETGNAIGARKLGVALQEGRTYRLSAQQSTDPSASVLLFLFDAQHRVIPFGAGTDQTPWLATSGESSPSFIAPDGVADIGIQVQSGYESSGTAYLTPSLRAIDSNQPDPSVTPVQPPQEPFPERPVPTPSNAVTQ